MTIVQPIHSYRPSLLAADPPAFAGQDPSCGPRDPHRLALELLAAARRYTAAVPELLRRERRAQVRLRRARHASPDVRRALEVHARDARADVAAAQVAAQESLRWAAELLAGDLRSCAAGWTA